MCVISAVEASVISVTPDPGASQEMAKWLVLPVPKAKTRKMQKAGKKNCNLESIPYNPRPRKL